jgi:hypothetical protein
MIAPEQMQEALKSLQSLIVQARHEVYTADAKEAGDLLDDMELLPELLSDEQDRTQEFRDMLEGIMRFAPLLLRERGRSIHMLQTFGWVERSRPFTASHSSDHPLSRNQYVLLGVILQRNAHDPLVAQVVHVERVVFHYREVGRHHAIR